jgi:diadenylate cyclase
MEGRLLLRDLLEMTHLGQFGWIDLLDVLLLAIIIYYLLLLIRGTRAVPMLVGVLVMAAAFWTSGLGAATQLRTVHRVLGSFLFYIPFAIIVIFQDTIRRGLAGLARNPIRMLHPPLSDSMIRDVAQAAGTLAERRHGALLVLARSQGMREQLETGILLDAVLSYDLLVGLFTPHAQLHDGAVIIADGRIKAAACFLPLSGRDGLERELGTRHRAALGITEVTDALAIVVSEETGTISLCDDSRMLRGLDPVSLANMLRERLSAARGKVPGPWGGSTHAPTPRAGGLADAS